MPTSALTLGHWPSQVSRLGCSPWLQAGQAEWELGCCGPGGGPPAPRSVPLPGAVQFVSQPRLPAFSGCSCVYESMFVSRSVLGCVTFNIDHRPQSCRIPAGSELLAAAPVSMGLGTVLQAPAARAPTRIPAVLPVVNNPLLSCPEPPVTCAESVMVDEPPRAVLLHGGPKGPAGLETPEQRGLAAATGLEPGVGRPRELAGL